MDDEDGATVTRIHEEIQPVDEPVEHFGPSEGPLRWESFLPEMFDDPNMDPAEVRSELRFCEIILHGTPRLDAAIEVGWSLTKLRRKLHDPGFIDLLEAVEQHQNQIIEQALYWKAKTGNMDAIKMWLFNRYPERWRDVRRIEVEERSEINVTVASSVKSAVIDLIRSGHTQSLQPGGILDVSSRELPAGD